VHRRCLSRLFVQQHGRLQPACAELTKFIRYCEPDALDTAVDLSKHGDVEQTGDTDIAFHRAWQNGCCRTNIDHPDTWKAKFNDTQGNGKFQLAAVQR